MNPTKPPGEILAFSPKIQALPVVHASGDFARAVRRVLLAERFDCVAVPLPPSFKTPLAQGIDRLPDIQLVTRPEGSAVAIEVHEESESQAVEVGVSSFVTIDPCQAVIAALRIAREERLATAFIDLEVERYEPDSPIAPDPYALKGVPLERFAAAIVPFLENPQVNSQRDQRIRWMAYQLHALELDYDRVLAILPMADWPWVRDAYQRRAPYPEPTTSGSRPTNYGVTPRTLYFVLGELPYATHLYEERRQRFQSDEHLTVDGVKELLIEARRRWTADRALEQQWVTPQLLKTMLRYMRNLSLMERRLAPDLYTIATAAKQVGGDEFATFVVETARDYPNQPQPPDETRARCGPELAELGDSGTHYMVPRLPGPPRAWRTLALKPRPERKRSRLWQMLWNPYGQCSWPPEDDRIECFNTHVREQARAIAGQDLARTEKFTTSIKDGLDIRETLRNWHTGDLYVRELPPTRGDLEIVIFLFESPPDAAVYSWQSTWMAEHPKESTLCFYATPFIERMVGPGVGLSKYGGAFFLFPPRAIPDIWTDKRFDFAPSLEDRLVAAALFHSSERHVALVSPRPPRARWRLIARRFKRRLVYLPLGRFSGQTVERLRHFHVLNGHQVRSYATRFIREF